MLSKEGVSVAVVCLVVIAIIVVVVRKSRGQSMYDSEPYSQGGFIPRPPADPQEVMQSQLPNVSVIGDSIVRAQ